MANENWMRTYTMRCGKMGKQGFEIGNVNSVTEDCLHVSFSVEKSSEESQSDKEKDREYPDLCFESRRVDGECRKGFHIEVVIQVVIEFFLILEQFIGKRWKFK